MMLCVHAGKDRSMLIPNCLFRSNGSAVLLSNRSCDAAFAKYSIKHLVRTNLAADDVAFNCVMQTEDAEGKVISILELNSIEVADSQADDANYSLAYMQHS